MDCWQNTSNPIDCKQSVVIEFPCGCPPIKINSADVIYTGNDLTNSGINTNDNLTLALAKLDDAIISISGAVPDTRTLTINGVTQDLSANRTWNTITLTSFSGGTGINYNNTTGVITNSAPDQVVTLTQGANVTITGTYPNFTIAASGGASGITVGTTTISSGTDTRIPFNDGGVYGEDSALTWNKTNNVLTVSNISIHSFGSGAGSLYIGNLSGSFTNTGSLNTFIGTLTGGNVTTGTENTILGYSSGNTITSGQGNTGLGAGGLSNVTTGSYNIGIGYSTSNITTGSQNVSIGRQANVPSATASGQLSIQNAIFGVNNTVLAGLSTGNIGIYIQAPTARLHLPAGTATAGTAPLKITNGGTLLTSPESGAIETTNTHIYWTNNSGTRFQLDQPSSLINSSASINSDSSGGLTFQGSNPDIQYVNTGNTITYYSERNLNTGASFGSWTQAITFPTNIPNDSSILVEVNVMGIQISATVGAKAYCIKMTCGVRKDNSGTYTLIGASTTQLSVIDSPDSIGAASLSITGGTQLLVSTTITTSVNYSYTINAKFSTGQ